MRFIILILIFFPIHFLNAQDYSKTRELRVFEPNKRGTVVKLKKNKSGEIKKLNQIIIEVRLAEDSVNIEEIFMIEEEYVKDYFWALRTTKGVIFKEKKHKTIYEHVLDGTQYYFNKDGRVIYKEQYNKGTKVGQTIGIKYYSNGSLKLIAEVKENTYWNILSYKDPAGEDHNFGDFKNGKGSIIHLNDEGESCLKYMHKNKALWMKNLCEEA